MLLDILGALLLGLFALGLFAMLFIAQIVKKAVDNKTLTGIGLGVLGTKIYEWYRRDK